ncbi:MAG: ABC transporter ATP-binding protein [Bacillota bacterium]|nr:ABC transporter ATP-binding protein [Bacillota bacterium]
MEYNQEHELEKSWDLKLLKKLMSYTKKWIPHLILAVFLLFMSTVSHLLRPKIIQMIVDDKLVAGTAENGLVQIATAEVLPDVFQLVYLLLGLVVLTLVASYIQTYMLNYIGQSIVYDIRSDLFRKMIALDLRFYEVNPVGRLVTRITNDLNNISQLYSSVLVTTLADLAIVGGSIVMMFAMHWQLALLSLSCLPLVVISAMLFRRMVRSAYRQVRIKIAAINASLNENITGMKTIQLFNQEEKFNARFTKTGREYEQASKKEIMVYSVFRPFINFLYFFSLAVAIYFGGNWVLGGTIKVGVVVAFTIYIQQLFRPILEFAEKFNILQSALTSIERVFLLFEEPERIENNPKAELKKIDGNISFRDVRFSYVKGEEVLRGISFDVKPGQTVAFVGHTGSGKSTIINLLMRMYDIDGGEILIDGVRIQDYDKYELRKHIVPVIQDVFLFSGDIRNNVRLLDERYTDEEVMKALEFVGADTFVKAYEDGLSHVVTEGGSTLSQGQRQLLSFARAVLRNPDVLVLDEATASIDTESEQKIQNAIKKVEKGRTTFIVAHRLSTIKDADQIIVLHKGEIREIGNHDELIARKGLYYDLYQLESHRADI